MSQNRRIFYAVEAVALAPLGTTSFTSTHVVHGLQSIGLNTRFNLEAAFEIGQIGLYANQETIPDIEATLEKCLDGYPLIYHLATWGAVGTSLNARCGNTKNQLALSIFPDTFDAASGTPNTTCFCSGVYVQSVAYHFPVEGISSEQVTLVGNNKQWGATGITFNGWNTTGLDAPAYGSGVARRWDFAFEPTGSNNTYTILPNCIEGISASGINEKDANGNYGAHVQDVRCSVNLGRAQMHELGRRGNYFRYAEFPVESRCEIEVYGMGGDTVSALEAGINADGTNQPATGYTIKIKSKEGTYIDLGNLNKLESVTYGGGNAGGRGNNVMETYSFQTWNQFSVGHPADPLNLGGY